MNIQTYVESWREYVEEVEAESKFQLVLENIENAKNEKDVDMIVESWIEEQEQLLLELDIAATAKKAKGYIDKKVNDFLLNLYFKAVSIFKKMAQVGMKVAQPAIKIIKFIAEKIGAFSKKHPFIAKIASGSLIALVLLCAFGLFTSASANPTEVNPESVNQYIDLLQGYLADLSTNINNLESGSDVLPPKESNEFKRLSAEAINHLESMKNKAGSLEDLSKTAGESKQIIQAALDFQKDLLSNPPEGSSKEEMLQMMNKWARAGEEIVSAEYQFEKVVDAFGSTEKSQFKLGTRK
jgi:hypothetical protein